MCNIYSANIGYEWAICPIFKIGTQRYKLQVFVIGLHESLQLSEELETQQSSSITHFTLELVSNRLNPTFRDVRDTLKRYKKIKAAPKIPGMFEV